MSTDLLGMSRAPVIEEFSFIEALTLAPKDYSANRESQDTVGRSLPPVPTSPTSLSRSKTVVSTKETPIKEPTRATTTQRTSPPQQKSPRNKVSKANMGTSKAQKNCHEVCLKTTKLGDRVSVRLLEYLTSAKDPSATLDKLAHGFLDTCQILFTIEAGLAEGERTSQAFPTEILAEMDKKFRICQAEFIHLEQMITKSVEYERKGTMGRMRRGWGRMFGEENYDKVIESLERTKESLRMSALMFHWSLGNEKVDNEMGIGYTALAAALDRLDKRAGSIHQKPTSTNNESLHHLPMNTQPRVPDIQELPLPPLPWAQAALASLDSGSSVASTDQRNSNMESRHMSNNTFSSSTSYERGQAVSSPVHDIGHMADDVISNPATIDSDGLLEEIVGLNLDSNKPVRLKAEPTSMPRWAPRHNLGAEAGSMKGALSTAIRTKNHKLLSSLLDQGVSPSPTGGHHPLKEAVFHGDTESVRLLLLFGANPEDPDSQGNLPLAIAAERGFFAGATMLLKYGADPNATTAQHMETPLAIATIANRVNMAHLMLIYGGDPSHLTVEGNTLLIGATNKKTPKKFIELLLDYGADPNGKSREGKTALFEAIQSGRADIVTTLLEHGANPNLPGPKHMLWPATYQSACLQVLLSHGADFKKTSGIMELATSINNIESVRILLKAGVNPNAKKDGVYTPLCTSIRDDRPDIFRLLLSNGADPNIPASEYPCFKCVTHHRPQYLPELVAAGGDLHSPKGIVETAVSSYDMDALNWLLDQGLNPNERNPKGESPLTTAIRENRMDMVELLLARGADPNMRGEDWPVCLAVHNPPILRRILSVLTEPRAFKGVMEMAVVANQLESVKLLLATGVSVEDKNGGVFSPLTTAIRENRKDIVVFLLNEGGADVNSPGEHLPIVKALRRFRTDMLEMLLDKGADPNKVYRGWNGMMQAVENGDLQVLKLLCDRAGVDLEVKDELGRTVTEIAASRGWDEAVAILIHGRKR